METPWASQQQIPWKVALLKELGGTPWDHGPGGMAIARYAWLMTDVNG